MALKPTYFCWFQHRVFKVKCAPPFPPSHCLSKPERILTIPLVSAKYRIWSGLCDGPAEPNSLLGFLFPPTCWVPRHYHIGCIYIQGFLLFKSPNMLQRLTHNRVSHLTTFLHIFVESKNKGEKAWNLFLFNSICHHKEMMVLQNLVDLTVSTELRPNLFLAFIYLFYMDTDLISVCRKQSSYRCLPWTLISSPAMFSARDHSFGQGVLIQPCLPFCSYSVAVLQEQRYCNILYLHCGFLTLEKNSFVGKFQVLGHIQNRLSGIINCFWKVLLIF